MLKLFYYRNLALLPVGGFWFFRQSELINIKVKDLIWEPEGLIIRLPHFKTDQNGDGLVRAIPKGNGAVCSVNALKNGLSISGKNSGTVFRSINRWDYIKDKALNSGAI